MKLRSSLVCLVLALAAPDPSMAKGPKNDGNHPGRSGRLPAKASIGWQPVLHEHDFKASPRQVATPDSLLVVELEPARSRGRARADSGAPGRDEIPFRFTDSMEREFCWEGDSGSGAPHVFDLRDARRRLVARVVEGGPCVSARIEPGDYTASFHSGEGRGAMPDRIFVRPAEMFAGPADGPPERTDSETGPGDPGSEDWVCSGSGPVPVPVSPSEVPALQNNLEDGQIALFFHGVGQSDDFAIILDGPCNSLTPYSEFLNLSINNSVHIEYWVTLFPRNNRRSVGLFYAANDFRGPRRPVPDYCNCTSSGCTNCNPTLVDPLRDFFVCATKVQSGQTCIAPPEILLAASLMALDPNPNNGDILISTNSCQNCDLRGSTALRGQNLSGVSIQGSDFSQSDLSDTVFDSAQADNAIFDSIVTDQPFSGHPSPRVSFRGAKLPGARFGYDVEVIFQDGDFVPVFNRRAGLEGADFGGGANLTGTWFPRARLARADLSHATLSGAGLPRADLAGADLSNANLSNASLRSAALSTLLPPAPGIDWCEPPDTSLCDQTGGPPCVATLAGATTTGVNLSRAKLVGVELLGRDLSNANAEAVEAYGADFSSSAATTRLDDAGFAFSDLRCTGFEAVAGTQADFTGARMTFSDLRDAALPRAIFSGAQLDPANLGGANLSDAVFSVDVSAQVGAADLKRSYMKDTILDGANLSEANLEFVSWFGTSGCSGGGCPGADGGTFTGTDLFCARLPHLYLGGASMRGVDLSSASLAGARLLASGSLVDLGPDGSNVSQLRNVDLRGGDFSGADMTGANLSQAVVLTAKGPTFGVWTAADPGRYTEPLVFAADDKCEPLPQDPEWVDQHECIPVTGNATTTPVTSGNTTCPDGKQTGKQEGCGQITSSPTNPVWSPTPPPTPSWANCPLDFVAGP